MPEQPTAALPRHLKVSLPEIEVPGCDDGPQLAGDYILQLNRSRSGGSNWGVLFEMVCGFRWMGLQLAVADDASWTLRLQLAGRERIVWEYAGKGPLSFPLELSLREDESQSQWPRVLSINAIGPSPTEESGGGSAEALGAITCPCPTDHGGKIKVTFSNIANDENCDDCTTYNTEFTLEEELGTGCTLQKDVDSLDCPDVFTELYASIDYDSDECEVRYWAFFASANDVLYELYIPFQEWDFAKVYTVPFIGAGEYGCDFTASSSTMVFVPDPSTTPEELNCGNKWGICNVKLIPLPVNDSAACEIKVPCCCDCGGKGVAVPGDQCTLSSCASGSCGGTIDERFGSVRFTLRVQDAGSGAFSSDVSYVSKTGSSGAEQSMSVADEYLQASAASRFAIAHKCDGSLLRYVCRDETSGVYFSLGGNLNTLVRNANGTYTETQGNYDKNLFYDFDSNGILFRVRKICPPTTGSLSPGTATWTVTHDTGNTHITDPFSRRTTTIYDGNGYPKRVQNPYGRITTFVFNSTGQPTQHITPELCTTEMIYDANKRLTTYIAPDSGRTSYTYDSDGWVTRVIYPNGGRYTYQYLSTATTTVADPTGSITTILHDLHRNITGVINPLGQRTTYQYSRELLDAVERPAGNRTTYLYKTFDTNVRQLEVEMKPSGRTTYIYDNNASLIATVNPLAGRTTLVRSANDRVSAEINPLNQRTSFVYNSSGKMIATVNPLGDRSTTVYNALAQVSARIDPLANRTSFSYDAGLPIAVKNPLGAISTTIYNLTNQPLVKIDALGNRTSMIYDVGGMLLATITPTGARTTNVRSASQLTATINPLGNRTSLAYDTRGNRIRVESPMSRINTFVYDNANRQVATIDASGLRSTTVYDANARPAARIASSGLRTTTLYDNNHDSPLATIAPNGARTSFTYNAADLEIRQTAPTGGITTTVYDVAERVVATIDPLGNRSTTIYDAAGRTKADVNALAQRTTMVYDSAGQVTATINPLGNRSSQVYDAAGRAVASINPLSKRWTSVYDAANRRIAQVDPLARRTTSIYAADGQQVASVSADGSRNTTVYDAANQTIATINARSYRSSMTYNADGQAVAAINALNQRTTNLYDSGGRPKATLDARGNRSTTIYNSIGRAVASQNALGNRWTTIFNSVGQVAATQNPLNNRTTNVYDAAGRTVASIQPLGQRSSTVYNVASQTIANVDANSNRTSMVYDALGREIAQVTPLGSRTTSLFNAAGQQTALIDARSNRQTFTYDAAGAQTQQIDALGQRTTLGYDAAGQQTLRLDARSNRTTYTFSSVGQVIGRKYPNGSRATFAYDSTGNRTLMADSTGRYTQVYDALNRTSAARNPQGKSLTYTYDAVGNRRSMQSADSGRFTYTFDAVNQNASVQNPFAERTTFAYDSSGRLTERRLSNATRTSYIYDANSRRTNVDNRTSAGAAIATFEYGYDNVGNPTSMVEASGDRVTWSYDSENRLLAERRSGASGYANTFTYDATGNRTLKNADSVRTTFSYNVANQLTYSQATAGRTTFSFDATGNQTVEQPPAGARTTTTWDYENQPTQYQLPDASRMTLAYNADSRRVVKQHAADTVKFIWDPAADAYQSELNAANVTQAVYTTPPVQFGQTISQRRSSTSHWYHPDSLGSTRALTNSSQTTTDTYLYDAWGNPLSSSGTTVNPFRWVGNVGYYFDEASGLYYIRARVYQPTIARWTSVDPLFYMLARSGMIGFGSRGRKWPQDAGSEIGEYIDWGSRYTYVRETPLQNRDPTGFFTIPEAENDYCNLDGPCSDLSGLEKMDCFRDCLRNRRQGIFDRWFEMERELGSWWAILPECPAALCIRTAALDHRRVANPFPRFKDPGKIGYHEGRFHPPPAYFSMRSTPVNGHSNQCIYDRDGNLITSPPAQGTVDYRAPGGPLSPHIPHDVDPVYEAAKLDGCWQSGFPFGRLKQGCVGPQMRKYYQVRPLWSGNSKPTKGQCCNAKNWSSWVWGPRIDF